MAAPAAVPLYDSCCPPEEPYRYVVTPPGAQPAHPPTVGRLVVHAPTAHTRPGYVNTAEIGPQASLYVPAGSLALPQDTRLLLLSVTPEAPPSGVRVNGRIAGNVYRVAATADARPISLRPESERPSLQLRAPSSKQPGPVLEHRDSTGWHRTVRTTRTGIDTYQAEINALGDWALVQLDAGSPSNDSGVNTDLLAGGIAVLVTTGLLVGLRFSRRATLP